MDEKEFLPFKFIGFQSGTAALAAALISVRKAQPLVENPTVILPAYTCPDVVSACLFARVKPKMVDFEQDKNWIDLDDLKAKIDNSCIAIIAINFLGIPERIESIRSVINHTCNKTHSITIIEDSAQGLPKGKAEEYWLGDIITCSFGRGKPLNLMGGGGIFYNPTRINEATRDNLKDITPTDTFGHPPFDGLVYQIKVKLFNVLSFPFYYYFLSKLPFLKLGETIFHPLNKINAIPSSIKKQFNANYKKYNETQSLRVRYDDLFNSLDSKLITSLPVQSGVSTYSPLLRYSILVKDSNIRELIYRDLSNAGVGISKMYQHILPDIANIKHSMFAEITDCTNAEYFAASLLTLPMHQDVKEQHIAKIKSVLLKYI